MIGSTVVTHYNNNKMYRVDDVLFKVTPNCQFFQIIVLKVLEHIVDIALFVKIRLLISKKGDIQLQIDSIRKSLIREMTQFVCRHM